MVKLVLVVQRVSGVVKRMKELMNCFPVVLLPTNVLTVAEPERITLPATAISSDPVGQVRQRFVA